MRQNRGFDGFQRCFIGLRCCGFQGLISGGLDFSTLTCPRRRQAGNADDPLKTGNNRLNETSAFVSVFQRFQCR